MQMFYELSLMGKLAVVTNGFNFVYGIALPAWMTYDSIAG